jgi:hypothetical protein
MFGSGFPAGGGCWRGLRRPDSDGSFGFADQENARSSGPVTLGTVAGAGRAIPRCAGDYCCPRNSSRQSCPLPDLPVLQVSMGADGPSRRRGMVRRAGAPGREGFAVDRVRSGWAGIAQKTGFGHVSPLPGIWPSPPGHGHHPPGRRRGLRGVRAARLAGPRAHDQHPDAPVRRFSVLKAMNVAIDLSRGSSGLGLRA